MEESYCFSQFLTNHMNSFECGAHDIFHCHRVANLALRIATAEENNGDKEFGPINKTTVYFAALCHDVLDSKLLALDVTPVCGVDRESSSKGKQRDPKSEDHAKHALRSKMMFQLTATQNSDQNTDYSPWDTNWKKFKEYLPLSQETALEVIRISEAIGFQKSVRKLNREMCNNREYRCVQDADFLDAIGMVGVARTFAYGGRRNRLLFGGIPREKFGYSWDPDKRASMHESFELYDDFVAVGKGSGTAHFFEKLLFIKDMVLTRTGRAMAEARQEAMFKYLLCLDDELTDAGFGESGNITFAVSRMKNDPPKSLKFD